MSRMGLPPLALATVMAAALTGCSAGPAPLKGEPPGEGVCYGASPHETMTDGIEALTNHSSQTVFFDRVGLRDPRHLKFLGAYLSPGSRYKVGAWTRWPPGPARPGDPVPRGWTRRHPVHGYRLRPGANAQVIVGFELTALPNGTSPGLLIWYHTARGSYVLRDDLAIVVGRINGKLCE
jgi:hypothetical protein